MKANENLLRVATARHRKTANFVQRLTGMPLDNCIEFAVLFEWHIAQHKGADHLIAFWRMRHTDESSAFQADDTGFDSPMRYHIRD